MDTPEQCPKCGANKAHRGWRPDYSAWVCISCGLATYRQMGEHELYALDTPRASGKFM